MNFEESDMLEVRKSQDRGQADHGWLKSAHSFSFADYRDDDALGTGRKSLTFSLRFRVADRTLTEAIAATGAIARTAANIRSGARSPLSGIVHALALMLFVVRGFLGWLLVRGVRQPVRGVRRPVLAP